VQPVTLTTERLTLDTLSDADVDAMTAYCQDPVLKDAVPIPWPYERQHADGFINGLAPEWWDEGSEYTWAIRETDASTLLGVIGFNVELAAIGYWMGEPHRGNGFMKEAAAEVARWAFSTGQPSIRWEAVVGNQPSASVAKSLGFIYTGTRPAIGKFRNDEHPLCWHATLTAPGEIHSVELHKLAAPWPV